MKGRFGLSKGRKGYEKFGLNQKSILFIAFNIKLRLSPLMSRITGRGGWLTDALTGDVLNLILGILICGNTN